jgi:hypothetical protein
MAIVNRNGLILPITSIRQTLKDFSTCLKFSGSAGTISLGTANPFTGSFYFAAWIKWYGNNGSYQTIFAKRDSYAANGLMFSMALVNTTSRISFDTVTTYQDMSTNGSNSYLLPKNRWAYLVFVHDVPNTQDVLYIDDQRITIKTISTLGTKTDALISIGSDQNPAQEFFNGLIDEVVIGTSAPSWSDVINMRANYQYPSVWTYLKLDEGSGAQALDSSGNSNNGTLTGTSYVTDKVTTTRSTAAARSAATGRTLI